MAKEELAYYKFINSGKEYAQSEVQTVDVADLGAPSASKHANLWRNKISGKLDHISPTFKVQSNTIHTDINTAALLYRSTRRHIPTILYQIASIYPQIRQHGHWLTPVCQA